MKKSFIKILLGLFSVFSLMIYIPLVATAKVTDIDKEITNIKSTIETQGKNLATASNQMTSIVDKFQTMNGDIGENTQKNLEQDKIIKDMQTRLQTLEDNISILTSQLQELRSEGLMKPKDSKRFREYESYAKSLEHVNSGQYSKAIEAFSLFQKENKGSLYENYAQYWIGESYYLQSDYAMAIKEYQKLLTANPKSAKAASALYKQGVSFFKMQSFEDAKLFLAKVIKTYPQSIEALQAKTKIKQIDEITELQKLKDKQLNSIE